MAMVALLRGVNVGGHKTFRPSTVARELSDFDVVNIGAAGTFVVRKAVSAVKFRSAMLSRLPFEAELIIFDGTELLSLEANDPFVGQPSSPELVRFVSILSVPGALKTSLPIEFPSEGDWLVRVIAAQGRFVIGMYRRHPKTIKYLGQIEKLFTAPVTTRNWNSITAITRVLKTLKR